jgi:hypothetical protein
MNTRTVRTFPVNGDLFPFIDQWAQANGYWVRASSGPAGPERLYQKGQGFLVAPMMLNVRQENGQVTLQSWVRINLFNRIASLFILPAEMGVESGGFKAILPRKMARDSVNHLLQQIGQPPIP